MRELSDFLLARIAEDEKAARIDQADAMVGWRWKHLPERDYHEAQDYMLTTSRRALRECEAKRRVVAQHNGSHFCPGPGSEDWQDEGHYTETPCPTVRNLADVYADHADFRAQWQIPRNRIDNPDFTEGWT